MDSAAVILAAGKGVRMCSAYPKVVHRVAGIPMIQHVIKAVQEAGISDVYIVVGHGREFMFQALSGFEVKFVVQEQQLGTGHALRQAESFVKDTSCLLVLSGDIPLIRSETLRRLIRGHEESQAIATVLSAALDDPSGYGRIVRNADRSLQKIVEERDADPEQKQIKEINSGIYCFKGAGVFPYLAGLTKDNAQGEYYLTDVLTMMVRDGHKVGVMPSMDSDDILGINDRVQMAFCEAVLRRRKNLTLMQSGVTMIDPGSVFVDRQVVIGADTVILPHTLIEGETVIGSGCEIGPFVRITNSTVGNGVSIESTSINEAYIDDKCNIGPFAYLRPGTRLGTGVKIGDFVEIKNSVIGADSKIPHLSYIGDAQVGKSVNIGAGTITCNYDGANKHPTVLEDGVFVGSNTNLVAPVRVGKDSVTGAGSTITRDVPPDTLAVERARQRNLEGWAKKPKTSRR